MIMVDITVPSVSRQYNFSIEEQVPISVLLAEISEVICQKENCVFDGDISELTICSREGQLFLDPAHTLEEYGIRNGMQLLLV